MKLGQYQTVSKAEEKVKGVKQMGSKGRKNIKKQKQSKLKKPEEKKK